MNKLRNGYPQNFDNIWKNFFLIFKSVKCHFNKFPNPWMIVMNRVCT